MDKKEKTIAERIKALFSGEEKKDKKVELSEDFAESTVKESGVVVAADAFEAGNILFMKTEEGDFIPAIEGTYELENGMTVTCDAEGVITEVKEAEGGEEEQKKEEKKEEQSAVSRAEFEALQEMMVGGFEQILSKLSETEKKKKVEQKSQEDEQREAQITALKLQLERKRKKVKQKTEQKEVETPAEMLGQNFGQKASRFNNATSSRVADNFKNFDFATGEVKAED